MNIITLAIVAAAAGAAAFAIPFLIREAYFYFTRRKK